MQVAFYGSTPNYTFVFDQLGRDRVTNRIRERQKAGDVAGMAKVIDDELVERFCISGDSADVADGLIDRYHGTATRNPRRVVLRRHRLDTGRAGPRSVGRAGSGGGLVRARAEPGAVR